jgi:hypothetical protein
LVTASRGEPLEFVEDRYFQGAAQVGSPARVERPDQPRVHRIDLSGVGVPLPVGVCMERHECQEEGIQTTDLEILAKAFFDQRPLRGAQTGDRFSGLLSPVPEELPKMAFLSFWQGHLS